MPVDKPQGKAYRLVAQVLLVLVSAAYPFLGYFGREYGAFHALAGLMCALWLLRAWFQRERGQKLVSLLLAAFFGVTLLLELPGSMYWYPVSVNALMLALFGGSLLSGQPLVERLARLQTPDLPPEGVRYTRRVTQIWCVFFVLNGSVAAALVWLDQLDWWAAYTGIVAYVLMGLLGGGEWLYRRFVLKIGKQAT